MTATYNDIETTCLIILDALNPYSRQGSLLRLLYNTGLRIEEAIQLKRFTIDDTTFTIDTEKNSLNRTFSLDLLPLPYLQYLPYNPAPTFLHNFSSYTNICGYIKRFADKRYYKGDKDILTNIYRYRYAYYLREEGYTVAQIQEAFGHLSVSSTLSYLAPISY